MLFMRPGKRQTNGRRIWRAGPVTRRDSGDLRLCRPPLHELVGKRPSRGFKECFLSFLIKPSEPGGREFTQVCIRPGIGPIDCRLRGLGVQPLGYGGRLVGSLCRKATECFQQDFFSRADLHFDSLVTSGRPVSATYLHREVALTGDPALEP